MSKLTRGIVVTLTVRLSTGLPTLAPSLRSPHHTATVPVTNLIGRKALQVSGNAGHRDARNCVDWGRQVGQVAEGCELGGIDNQTAVRGLSVHNSSEQKCHGEDSYGRKIGIEIFFPIFYFKAYRKSTSCRCWTENSK